MPIFNPSVGGPTWQYVVKAVDETVNNSAVYQNDNELAFAVAANAKYHVVLILDYTSATAADLKFQFTIPAGAATQFALKFYTTAGASVFNLAAALAGTICDGGGAAHRVAKVEFLLINGATPGICQLQWAQQTANASDTIVRANSCLGYRILS